MTSALEETFALAWRAAGGPHPTREYRFAPPRRWRFDFAWPRKRVAVEVEGGVFSGGRHNRGAGYVADCAKYNAAAASGWLVLRFTGPALADPEAVVRTVKAALALRRAPGLRAQLRAAHRMELARDAKESGCGLVGGTLRQAGGHSGNQAHRVPVPRRTRVRQPGGAAGSDRAA